jgi:hypothetical protein
MPTCRSDAEPAAVTPSNAPEIEPVVFQLCDGGDRLARDEFPRTM